MITGELYELTIREAAQALREGALTSVELTESVLRRIEATEPRLNAYIAVTADLAREQALAADRELAAGRDRGPLHGIPFALKDLIDTAGVPTTAGSDFLRDRVPTRDAFVWTKLREAGAVLTGKLGLHEFAFGATSNNPHFGPVRNPWDPERIPGGSSGGSGAAVAAGSCLGALGTDTGGSIRIPASLCGVVGLMPTLGRVGRSGVIPLSWTLDHVGPLARTVEDCALILNAIAGHDPDDPGSADAPVDDYTRDIGRDIAGIRIGVVREPFWRDCDDEITVACEAALSQLQALGATVSEVELPLLAAAQQFSFISAEAAVSHADWLRDHADRYSKAVRSSIEAGREVTATTYIQDHLLRHRLVGETRAVLEHVDVLVSPTTPITAPTIEADVPGSELARLTMPHDLTGIPAISLPCGFTSGGLPIGLMIGGRHFDEATVCRVAHAYEEATEWRRRPPL